MVNEADTYSSAIFHKSESKFLRHLFPFIVCTLSHFELVVMLSVLTIRQIRNDK